MRVSNSAVTLFAGWAVAACVTNGDDQSGSTTALLGEEWVVEDIGARGVIDYARATMLFGQDGRLSGNTSCNSYFADYKVDGAMLQIENAGVTKRACAPAVMDQESRFLNLFNAVNSYHIDGTGALLLSTSVGATITARRVSGNMRKTTYHCPDGSFIEAWYPTTDTARIVYQGRSIEMTSAVSASGARYVGAGWEWWTKGMTEGTLSPLAEGESIATASGMTCTAP